MTKKIHQVSSIPRSTMNSGGPTRMQVYYCKKRERVGKKLQNKHQLSLFSYLDSCLNFWKQLDTNFWYVDNEKNLGQPVEVSHSNQLVSSLITGNESQLGGPFCCIALWYLFFACAIFSSQGRSNHLPAPARWAQRAWHVLLLERKKNQQRWNFKWGISRF